MVGFEVGFSMFQNVCSPEAKKVGRDWHGRVVTQAGLERKRDFLVAGVSGVGSPVDKHPD